MATAKKGDFVEIDYVGSTEDGVIFDTSIGVEADFEGVMDDTRDYKPLRFKLGCHEIPPAIEEAILGMEEGESKTFRLCPEKGYGPHDDHKIREIHLNHLRKGAQKPILGQQMVLTDNKSRAMPGRVIKVENDTISVDFNHPLAGKVLVFTVKLLSVNKDKGPCEEPI